MLTTQQPIITQQAFNLLSKEDKQLFISVTTEKEREGLFIMNNGKVEWSNNFRGMK